MKRRSDLPTASHFRRSGCRKLRGSLQPGDTYMIFGALPHLIVRLPVSYALRSPTSICLGASTSRSEDHRLELRLFLAEADALVDTGGLDVSRDQIYPQQRVVYDLFRSQLAEFPCVLRGSGVTVRQHKAACGGP